MLADREPPIYKLILNGFFMNNFKQDEAGKCYRWIYTRYIVKNGRRIYPKKSKAFRFKVEVPCASQK